MSSWRWGFQAGFEAPSGWVWLDSLSGFSQTPSAPRVAAGRIKAIQLEYSEARRTMTNALRKAPQHTAVGFKQTVSEDGDGFGVWYLLGYLRTHDLLLFKVHKLLIVVELLLGEIPDRLQFRQPSLKRSLMPYFLLTQGRTGRSCPRSGSLCCPVTMSPALREREALAGGAVGGSLLSPR